MSKTETTSPGLAPWPLMVGEVSSVVLPLAMEPVTGPALSVTTKAASGVVGASRLSELMKRGPSETLVSLA